MESIQRIRIDYPDNDIQVRVKSFLSSRHFPAFREIDVQVDNGTVTLQGQVNSYYEKQVALNSCQHVAGVLATVDQIVVQEVSSILEPADGTVPFTPPVKPR